MRVKNAHLTYCTNIYPGESFSNLWDNIFTHGPKVKKAVSPNAPMGIGIWLSEKAAKTLLNELDCFKKQLKKEGLYVFTINAFPFGNFHGERVKEAVYKPDWSDKKRLEHTRTVARILAELLPEDVRGSISTVPITYQKSLPDNALDHILNIAEDLRALHDRYQRHIRLAFEPEPDCYLENIRDCQLFFKTLKEIGDVALVENYLGVCLDTCHFVIEYESLSKAIHAFAKERIPILKIQISSALTYEYNASKPLSPLYPFDDAVYLHQTRVLQDNTILRYKDLTEALKEKPYGKWLIHYHMPLHFSPPECGIGTTSFFLTSSFFKLAMAHTDHLEIETYTFDVLPDKTEDVDESIIKELKFVLRKIT